ncbi:MAG TPA: dihydrofolate reductase family protein [Candidatus Baltobacteraceae bacterium]|jgi:dihydrofolate reductase|nr:dihydrofolate reductase family protein [Candidatus Baltobacteraceae bacterium]
MNISVFAGVSLDGFLARKNDDLDFLPDGGNPEYGMFIATVDAMVIGRRTFEKVLTFEGWPYGKMPVFVLSANPLDVSVAKDGVVEHLSGDPAEIVERLRGRGFTHLYVDGGVTVQRFLRAGLVTRLIVTHVPVLIGEGIPLFGPLPKDIQLAHVRTTSYESGLVTSEYTVA